MLQRPVFKPHYQVTVIPGEGVLLWSERGARALHGALYEAIAPLLDGRSADAVVDTLAGRVEPARVYYTLTRLEQGGYLTEHAAVWEPPAAAFWHGLGLDPPAAGTPRRVRLVALDPVAAEPVRQALEGLGIAVTGPDDAAAAAADLDLVLTDDHGHGDLPAFNRAALASGRRWLLAKPSGVEIWLGPLFVPGQSPCHECLRPRLERHRITRRFAARKQGLDALPPPPPARLPASLTLAAQLIALEVARILADAAPSPLAGGVLSLDLADMATRRHALTRDPLCPACGDPRPAAPPPPLELVSRPVAFVRDGGHRSVSPERTLERYGHLVSPITGAVRMLEPVHRADGIAHVYVAGHNYALPMESLDFLKRNLRNSSAGKGITDAQARASALCEALERDSSLFTGREYRVRARYRDLGGEAVHPTACMLFSERQYRERAVWNARRSRYNWVPEPFDDDRPVDWSPVWSLTERRHKLLPTQYLYFQAPAADDDRTFYCVGCSNGNASGNNREEAVLQGFCELVERDAVAFWWYGRLTRPGVDLDSFGEPYLLDLVAYYDARGRDTWALDLTADLGIPVFVAVSRRRAGEERILFGFGCHLDPRIALQRAFAEMNQMLGMIADLDDPGSGAPRLDEETRGWLRDATLALHPHLAPAAGRPPRRRADFPDQSSGDLLRDIDCCRSMVEARDLEMLVHDLTRPGVGLPVVKVIVPGLRHFWARFAPGRLYDVPVAMGWLPAPLTEEALNPVPMFI